MIFGRKNSKSDRTILQLKPIIGDRNGFLLIRKTMHSQIVSLSILYCHNEVSCAQYLVRAFWLEVLMANVNRNWIFQRCKPVTMATKRRALERAFWGVHFSPQATQKCVNRQQLMDSCAQWHRNLTINHISFCNGNHTPSRVKALINSQISELWTRQRLYRQSSPSTKPTESSRKSTVDGASLLNRLTRRRWSWIRRVCGGVAHIRIVAAPPNGWQARASSAVSLPWATGSRLKVRISTSRTWCRTNRKFPRAVATWQKRSRQTSHSKCHLSFLARSCYEEIRLSRVRCCWILRPLSGRHWQKWHLKRSRRSKGKIVKIIPRLA